MGFVLVLPDPGPVTNSDDDLVLKVELEVSGAAPVSAVDSFYYGAKPSNGFS